MRFYWWFLGIALMLGLQGVSPVQAEPATLPGLDQRFAGAGELPSEVPDFQKHVSPLLGRLGCNGRACHGSFQGRGGFRLSLFGYDFKADHEALLDKEAGRVNLANKSESLLLTKPADAEMHEGGKRFEVGSWQERVLQKWVASGATFDQKIRKLERLEVSPQEMHFNAQNETNQLKAIAVWEDGTREDVTPLCRFTTNDSAIAEVDENGRVVSGEFKGDSHVVVYYDNAVVPIPVVRPVSDLLGDRYPAVATKTEVDRLVLEKLKKVGILPSELCDDATFLRRVSLDLSGTLPSEKQVRSFLQDPDPAKREKLVEQLLGTEGYAAWWTTKLCDWTGNNDSLLRNTLPSQNASNLWYEWIYKRVADNMPYDQIVSGIVEASSRNEGESYLDYCKSMSDSCRDASKFAERDGNPLFWARTNFRTKEDRAIGFAYTFLGIRIQCAQCHKHPFDQWSQADFEQFSELFTQVQFNANNVDAKGLAGEDRKAYDEMMAELKVGSLKGNDLRRRLSDELRSGETVPFNELSVRLTSARANQKVKDKAKEKKVAPPQSPTGQLLGGGSVSLSQDARDDLMGWLRSPENPYFAKAMVNRMWAHYFGKGIVNPSDDLNLANPPSNAPLFDYLAKGFIESGFDMKWLHRTIVLSETYQRSWEPNDTNQFDTRNFSRFVPRRLPAEIMYDAMVSATGNDERQEQMTIAREGRALEVADYDPRRRTNGMAYALSVFGRSTRESNCDCDRSEEPSLLQTVFLRNDREVLDYLASDKGWVNQTCRSLNVAGPANAPQAQSKEQDRKLETLEKLQASLRKQADRLKDNPKYAAQLEKTERRLKEVRRQLADMEPVTPSGAKNDSDGAKISEADALKVVQSAYLRTLSREPTAAESSRSVSFITGSQKGSEGIEGLLWALINTKEFSLNH